MAITPSPRLGITRWSADTDIVSRAQFDGDHGKLDALIAMAIQGLAADRPAAAIQRRLYYATDTGVLSLDNGSAWVEVLTGPRGDAAYLAKTDNLAALTDKTAARENLGANAAYVAKAGSTMTGLLTLDAGLTSARMRIRAAFVSVSETSTSTTYAALATAGPAVTFTAPPSGEVLLLFSAAMRDDTAGHTAFASVRVTDGAGAVVADVSDEVSLQVAAAVTGQGTSRHSMVRSLVLTAGLTYTATMLYRVTGGTGLWGRRSLTVIPIA
jgi:hypothetical protein